MRMRGALTNCETLKKVPQQTGRENVTEISDETFSMKRGKHSRITDRIETFSLLTCKIGRQIHKCLIN